MKLVLIVWCFVIALTFVVLFPQKKAIPENQGGYKDDLTYCATVYITEESKCSFVVKTTGAVLCGFPKGVYQVCKKE